MTKLSWPIHNISCPPSISQQWLIHPSLLKVIPDSLIGWAAAQSLEVGVTSKLQNQTNNVPHQNCGKHQIEFVAHFKTNTAIIVALASKLLQQLTSPAAATVGKLWQENLKRREILWRLTSAAAATIWPMWPEVGHNWLNVALCAANWGPNPNAHSHRDSGYGYLFYRTDGTAQLQPSVNF